MNRRSKQEAEQFIEANYGQLALLAGAMTANASDATDLLQASLERLYKHWLKSRVDNPWALTKTIMTRINIDSWRGRQREVLTSDLPESEVVYLDGLSSDLLTALRSLTQSQRTALALRYLEDMPFDEIAQIMMCGESTVRSHLSRGAERLRFALSQEKGATK